MKSVRSRVYNLTIIVVIFLLAIITVFSVAGCSLGAQNDLQAKIDDLQSQLNDRQSQIEELEERLAEMEDQLRDRDERIDQLEKELAEKSVGALYTVREAYDNGWLTYAELMSIAYYHNGGRIYNEEIMSEDYVPLPKTPEVLSNLTELKIKNTAAKEYREIYHLEYAEADGFTIAEYCGTYNGCIVVRISDIYPGADDVILTKSIAGVKIYSYNAQMRIWRENR